MENWIYWSHDGTPGSSGCQDLRRSLERDVFEVVVSLWEKKVIFLGQFKGLKVIGELYLSPV